MTCRLCGAATALRFTRWAPDGETIAYYECEWCRSLQTQEPHWLQQAYEDDGSPNLDTYVAERTILNQTMVYFLFKLCGLKPEKEKVLDWGGGPGLFVRMLRDLAIDAYHYDKYESNRFASPFGRSHNQRYSFITCFEVWEHFVHPAADVASIFELGPQNVLISTCLYNGQDDTWPYLGPPKGQHIFFYSERAMEHIAALHGYRVTLFPPDFALFHQRPISKLKRSALRRLMSRPRLRRIAFAIAPRRSFAEQDNLLIRTLTASVEKVHEPERTLR